MKVKSFLTIICLILACLSLASCKTIAKKDAGSSSDVKATKGADGVIRVPVPQAEINQNPVLKSNPSQTVNFGLTDDTAAPTTTSNTEQILKVQCYQPDGSFAGKNWYFWSQISTGGAVIATQDSPATGCAEMGITLGNVSGSTTYTLTVAFYYMGATTPPTKIVYYQGTTQFKPSDSTINLVMQKQIFSQDVLVSQQESPKDTCLADNYFWNGNNCINQFNTTMFAYTQKYGNVQSTGSIQPLCFGLRSDQQVVTVYCSSLNSLKVMPYPSQIQPVAGTTGTQYSWYLMQVVTASMTKASTAASAAPTKNNSTSSTSANSTDTAASQNSISSSNYCLTSSGGTTLSAIKCDQNDKSQMFAIVPAALGTSGVGGVAYADSFRIVQPSIQAQTTASKLMCASVPSSSQLKGTVSLQEGLNVTLSDCSTTDPVLMSTEYIVFTN